MSPWIKVTPTRRAILMWGAADQARVNRPILGELGCELVALVDDTPGLASPFADVPIYESWNGFNAWRASSRRSDVGFVVAIGNPYGHVRCALADRLSEAGLEAVSFAAPSALVSSHSSLGAGLQVMPHAIIHHHVDIGRQCIVNTRALVEHDCVLAEGVEIGPGAVLCGRVSVGRNSWVGAGATVRPRIRIGNNVIIGAGAVVVSDIPDGVVAVGSPARPLAGRSSESAATSVS